MSEPARRGDAATQPPPTVMEIQELIRNRGLSLAERNHAITDAYHRISEAMRAKLDAGPNLDWCGFAKWSSHTVGLNFEPDGTGARASEQASMIVERLPRILRFVRPAVERLLKRFIDVEDGLVSKALRGGNGSIFVEMGSIFVKLIDRLPESGELLQEERSSIARSIVEEVLAAPGRDFLAPLDKNDLDDVATTPLEQGIEYYLRARDDHVHRAELMLAGNMLFSQYEQTRADRLITIGMCAPIRARLIPMLNVLPGNEIKYIERLMSGRRHRNALIGRIERAVIRTLTGLALVIRVGDRRFSLGHPERLPAATVVPTLPDVVQIMDVPRRWAASRPRNWLDLDYRLGFISQYFAAVQQDPDATREPPDTEIPPPDIA